MEARGAAQPHALLIPFPRLAAAMASTLFLSAPACRSPEPQTSPPGRQRAVHPVRNDEFMAIHSAPLPRATAKALDAWLRNRAKAVRLPLTAAIGIGACGGLLLIVQAWLLGHVVNRVVIDHRGLASVWPYLWAMLAVF